MTKEYLSKNAEDKEYKEIKEEEIMDFFRQFEPYGDIFVGYWGYHIRVDPRARSFYFDHRNKAIGISPRLIEKLNLAEPEKIFAFFHELGHLVQLFQSPDSYLESFNIPKQKAKEAKKEVQGFIKKAWRIFFNIFFDIHDNSIVRRRIFMFQTGEKYEHLIQDLYKNKLFNREDLTDLPYSEQFVNFLIKKTMAPGSECRISSEVEEIINQPIRLFGFEYSSVLDFVKREIFNPEHTCEDLMFNLSERLMPLFEQLLKQDIANSRTKLFQELTIDLDVGLTEEVIKDILEGHNEAQKPSSGRINDSNKEEFRSRAKAQGFNEEQIGRMLEIKEITQKIHQDLRNLWDNFVQRSIEIQEQRQAGFRTGVGVAGERLGYEVPVLLTRPTDAKIFYRYILGIEREDIKPKKIDLVLIVDLSGSMDQKKRNAVQEVAYTTNKSLIDWYRDVKNALRDYGEEPPIDIDLNIIGFGSSVKKEMMPKSPQEKQERKRIDDPPEKDIEQQLWQAIFDIQATDLGGTKDALALELLEKSIVSETKERLDQGEEIKIVLEITDGETATVEESKRLVKSLNQQKGVFVRAIQIPGPIHGEGDPEIGEKRIEPPNVLPPTGTFKEVWGIYGRRLENLSLLKKTIFEILRDALEEHSLEGD